MMAGVVINVEALIRLQNESYVRADGGLRSSWPPNSAMDADGLKSFLSQRRYCVLATTTSRGHALARPVAFTVMASGFWFATVAGSRVRSLERMPWGSIVIAEGEGEDHRAIVADGPAAMVREPSEELLILWEERHGSRAEWASAWFEIKPTRLLSYSARKPRA
jgi:hypothetical protein